MQSEKTTLAVRVQSVTPLLYTKLLPAGCMCYIIMTATRSVSKS